MALKWQTWDMTDTGAWDFHYRIEEVVPDAPERIGYSELQHRIEIGQRGRLKRAVSSLVAMDVLQWQGLRNGRAVARGGRPLSEAIAAGLVPMPDREIDTYQRLAPALDAYITEWHLARLDPIDSSGEADSGEDGVTTYVTSATRVAERESTVYSRPDLTVIVDLSFDHLGPWNEVHAVEVKPYWAVNRASLYEAAAQAALRQCTFSWLLVWIPKSGLEHFRPAELALIGEAESAMEPLTLEAKQLGIGLLRASSLDEGQKLEGCADPTRQAMEPKAANRLFTALRRSDSNR
jgi:hypothetical protein